MGLAMRRTGFSLVEVVVAVALIGLLLAFVLTVFPSIHEGARLAENHANAAFLGQSLLNQERARGFDNAVARTGSWNFPITVDKRVVQQQMTYQVDVQALDAYRKRIWVTLSWSDGTGAKKVVVETMLAGTK